MSGKVHVQIEPLDEEELEKDLRFALSNRWETDDQLIEELIPTIKYHLNEAMARFQLKTHEDIVRNLSGELAGIIMRSRRRTVVEKPDEIPAF